MNVLPLHKRTVIKSFTAKLNPNIEAHRQILIDTFVNAVYVYDDKLLLTFNFTDGTKTISFADVATATGESGSDMNCLGAPRQKLSLSA